MLTDQYETLIQQQTHLINTIKKHIMIKNATHNNINESTIPKYNIINISQHH